MSAVEADLRRSDVLHARLNATEAVRLAQSPFEQIKSTYWLAKCHYVEGEIDTAMSLATEVCAIATKAADPLWVARAQTLQSRCLELAGESHAAHDLAIMAVQEVERVGCTDEQSRSVEQGAVLAVGIVCLQLGDLQLAEHWCCRSIDLARGLLDQSAYGAALDTLACVYSARAARARAAGDHDQAIRAEHMAATLSAEAVEVARRVGHTDYETTALLNLAESLTLVGEPAKAQDLLEDWARRYPTALPRQWSHQRASLGQIHIAMERPAEAVMAFEAALKHCESEPFRAVITEHLAEALERCGRWKSALARYKEFHRLQERVGAERAQRSARVAAAHVDIERERARFRQLSTSNADLRRRADDLTRKANEDPLTGLPNRRPVEERLAVWPQPVAAAMIDVDHFKHINDTFSHAVGDEVLRQLSKILRGAVRPSDVVARWGGEEFLVLFHDETHADPISAAERVRVAVERYDWAKVAKGLKVTISIGMAMPNEVGAGSDLLDAADRRLYLAKRAGRNQLAHEN